MTSTMKAICAAVALACSASAQAYQPGEVFRLDLNQAVLSPQPIGPPAQFEPAPVEAKDDTGKSEAARPPAAKTSRAAKAAVRAPRTAANPRPVAKKQIARRSNPLDANAFDTRVQVWPCRSGGICQWRK
jgi:hypothetical protein